jgi:hypothetical protein
LGQGHQIRGFELTGFDLIYTIGTANLTSLTPSLYRSVYADAVAVPATTNPGGAITVNTASPLAFRSTMHVVNYTVATPFVIGNNAPDVDDRLELAIVDPGSSVFNFYGIFFYYNYCIL